MTDWAFDPTDAIMRVMDAAFDPQFGEAWNRRQVADALLLSYIHIALADATGGEPVDEAATVAFVMLRHIAGEEELLLIAVDPDHRGKGVAAQLLLRVLEDARNRGASRIFLEMRDGNSAERLYRNNGFAPIGRRKDYYRRGNSGPYDAVTFARQID